jgi:hypothetical protein
VKISKNRLLQIIREEAKSTEKYDDDPALKGDQDELPDALQKGIIDKSKTKKVQKEERSKRPERDVRNESRRLGRNAIRRMVRDFISESQHMSGEPLAGDDARDPSSDFWVGVRTPEAVEAFKAAGFTSDGKMADRSKGLGVLEMGMYTPQNQQEIDAAIKAALEINVAILEANKALTDGKYRYSRDAYSDIVAPVQSRHSRTGASDTEGRETVGSWMDEQGWEWD